jgi:hypothetical protein
MSKWVHRLSDINTEANTATCSNCGVDSVVKKKGRFYRCNNGLNEISRRLKYRRKYGIEVSDIPQSCEVCGSSYKISYDHCHISGKFRGWLCMKCNTALGLVGDNVDILNKLIDYLKRDGS